MKLFKYLLPLACFALLPLASCSDDDGEKITKVPADGITYNTDGIWTGWDKAGNLPLGDFSFSHVWTQWTPEMGTSMGFVASRSSDTGFYTPMYDHQFTVITGGGLAGPGTPFIVGNWDSSETDMTPLADRKCVITRTDGAIFRPVSVAITNTCYAYYSMLNGDNYAKKFAKGDSLTLLINGVTEKGVKRTVEFKLADCGDDPEAGILKTWKVCDLSPLGTVKAIYFTMTSSDFGQFGMNTPAYFALDDFMVVD